MTGRATIRTPPAYSTRVRVTHRPRATTPATRYDDVAPIPTYLTRTTSTRRQRDGNIGYAHISYTSCS